MMEAKELGTVVKAALSFASKDDTRPHLWGVHFDFTGERTALRSTDGHRCFEARVETGASNDEEKGHLVLRDEAQRLEKWLRSCPKGQQVEVVLDATNPRVLCFKCGALEYTARADGDYFPPLGKVTPPKVREDHAVPLVGVNPTYLADAGRAVEAVHGKATRSGGNGLLEMRLGENALDPIRFDHKLNGVELTLVVMPMRVTD